MAQVEGQGMWTVKRCLDWTRDYLSGKGDDKARLAAEWLLCAATGLSRIELYMNYDRPLSQGELDLMHRSVVRRAKGEPLQYIAGRTAFRFIDVECAPGVLIPRPETEILVDEVLSFIDGECTVEREVAAEPDHAVGDGEPEAPAASAAEGKGETAEEDGPAPDAPPTRVERVSAARVLEVGCGTGCIALSVARERPGTRVVATDISPAAVALAVRNRDALGLQAEVDVREGDLVSPVLPDERGTFDVLVSNPPYIPSDVMETLPAEVARFEPALALDGGADGLDVFRRLVDAAPYMLRAGGLLACELHETTLGAAVQVCLAAGMEDVRVVEDLAHRPRVVCARVRRLPA